MYPGKKDHGKKHPVDSTLDHKPVSGATGGNIVTIDAVTKLPTKDSGTSLAAIIGGINIVGSWDANTNTPALASGVGVAGNGYIVSVNGSTNLDGITDWKIDDVAWFDGTATVWRKIDNTQDIHALGGALHSADTLANLLTKISDVTTIITNKASEIFGFGDKATPVDADVIVAEDSASAWAKVKITMANLKKDLLDLAGTRAMTGDLDIGGNKVTNATSYEGTAASDACVEAGAGFDVYLKIGDSGGVNNAEIRDSSGAIVFTVTSNGIVTATGKMVMGGNPIENVTDPTNPQDADTQAARDVAITTHTGLPSAHHAKYTDGEAQLATRFQDDVTLAGVTPVNADVSAWSDKDRGIGKGTTGRIFMMYKGGTVVLYVELT